jgi:hypothetical protein
MLVIPNPSRLAQLDALVAAQLNGGSLRLYQNNLSPNRNTDLADLVEATYSGYANKTVAIWGTSFLDPQGFATSIAPVQTFASTADTVANTVYGAYYLDAGGDLVWVERFAAPAFFAEAGNTLNLVPKYQSGEIDDE